MSRRLSVAQRYYRDNYLQSPWWRHVRYEVGRRDGYRCSVCKGKKRLEHHHLSYEHRGEDKEIDEVVILCRVHHMLCHYKWFGLKKVSLYGGSLKKRYKSLKRSWWRHTKPSKMFKI